jgi:hypothetical protein
MPVATVGNTYAHIVLIGMLRTLSLHELIRFWKAAELVVDGSRLFGFDAYRHLFDLSGGTPVDFAYAMVHAIARSIGTDPGDYQRFWIACIMLADMLVRKIPLVQAHQQLFLEKGKEYEPIWSLVRMTKGVSPLGEVEFFGDPSATAASTVTFAYTFDKYYRRYDVPEAWMDAAPITGAMTIGYGVRPLARYHQLAELARMPCEPSGWVRESTMPLYDALSTLGLALRRLRPPNWEVTVWRRRHESPFYPERCIYGAPIHICRYFVPPDPRIDETVSASPGFDLDAKRRELEGKRAALEHALREPLTFRYNPADGSVFMCAQFVTSGIQGRILHYILRQCIDHGRCELERRELADHPELVTSRTDTGLSLRLARIRQALAERCPRVRLVSTGRGRFRVEGAQDGNVE